MLKSVKYRLSNTQKGLSLISYSRFRKKVMEYRERYVKELPIDITTNVKRRSDVTLSSVCVDKAIEYYLHSQRYTMKHIGVILNPFHYAPKTAVLLCYSKAPVSIHLKVISADSDVEYHDISSLKQYHRISITGLGNGTNRIRLSFYDETDTLLKRVEKRLILSNVKDLEKSPIVNMKLSAESSYKQILVTGGTVDPFIFDTKGSIFHFFDFKKTHTSQYGIYPIQNEV